MKKFMIILAIFVIAAGSAAVLNGCNHVAPASSSTQESPVSSASPSRTSAPLKTPSARETALPEGFADSDIFADAYGEAQKKLAGMSTEEKVGQMILAHCPDEGAAEAIRSFHPGGFLLFESDFEEKTADEVTRAIQSYQDASQIPMIMAVDEEGGRVVRVSSNPNLAEEKFSSPRDLYEEGGLDRVREDAVQKAQLLKDLGLNLNLAPVADVSQNPLDYIYFRTLGRDAEETARYVTAALEGAQAGGISSALKHFPGYGGNADTHLDLAVDERLFSAFEQSDFLPFEAGIDAGAECVLVSHNIVQCMDPDYPASLSPKVHTVLRDDLQFTGLVITDDLSMAAVQNYAGESGPFVQAALAGNDLILTSELEQTYDALLSAIRSGQLPMETVDRAVLRILAFKYEKGLMQEKGLVKIFLDLQAVFGFTIIT